MGGGVACFAGLRSMRCFCSCIDAQNPSYYPTASKRLICTLTNITVWYIVIFDLWPQPLMRSRRSVPDSPARSVRPQPYSLNLSTEHPTRDASPERAQRVDGALFQASSTSIPFLFKL